MEPRLLFIYQRISHYDGSQIPRFVYSLVIITNTEGFDLAVRSIVQLIQLNYSM